MFTGLVEEVGTVSERRNARMRVAVPRAYLDDAEVGGSIAVDGCCLTVVALGEDADRSMWWEADVSDETARRTTLGEVPVGRRVNLERPVRLADRLGGHLVQGHVDGVGEVLDAAPVLRVALPPGLARYLAEKGSVTVDGVSLTVATVAEETFTAAVIPHTATSTTLGEKAAGDRVNLEVDIVAKYVERLLAPRVTTEGDRR
ncbi:MAG: riboflavin synthase [Actinobacteria bacterium]|nr:riboflavin synthase [Actinomycetota bacterium]MBW3642867.1 riboflavin synthase [Actinomycetota bacterium]